MTVMEYSEKYVQSILTSTVFESRENGLKPNRIFVKMIFSYLPIFYSVVVIIFVVSTVLIHESSQKQTLKTKQALANHAVAILEQTFKSIDGSVINEIDQNEDLRKYLYTKDRFEKYYYANKVSDAFNALVVNNKWINSVYLYSIADETVISSSISTRVEAFGDEAFIRALSSDTFPVGWTNKREYKELEYDRLVSVFSIVKPFPLFTAEKGYIVVNVNVGTVQQLLNEMTNSDVGSLNLYDKEGLPLFGEQGKDMLLVRSDYLGWSVGTSIGQSGSLAWASTISMWWIVFGLCAVLMGTLAIIFISFKQSKPIEEISRQILSYVDQAFGKKKKDRNDDFKFIQSALQHLIKDSSQSKQHLKENINFRRQQLFQELMNADDANARPRWSQELHELGHSGDYDAISIFVIEIDNYSVFSSRYVERDQDLMKFAISCVVKEVFEAEGVEVWTNWMNQQQAASIAFLGREHLQTLSDCWRELQSWIGQNLKLTVTLGVTETLENADHLHVSFHKALNALDYKSVYGSNAVIAYENIDAKGQGEVFEHLLVIRSIGHSFREGDPKWSSTLDELIGTMRERSYSRTNISNLLQYLVYQLYKDISGLPLQGEDPIKRLNEAADAVETIEDIEGPFKAALEELAERIYAFRGKQSNKSIVYEAKAYIEDHYDDPDLSLSMLGEKFEIHSSYLSRLFKEEFNENFVDMLARVRIERAKALLENSNDTLQEIAAKVGYTHYFSFSRVFKKLEKMPVSQYRKMMDSQSDHLS
ncbi:AraC family transcriptional regulator [Paenibacillus agaridevorans]|uniref:AraC family transcriptional regulator n=1 Tax=Paenibacillus agaridevorans TaxID=171404 RepID=UPI000D5A031D|nr:AraC family transcriptional regulator [Paenibacillus agaridevorans]